MGIRESFQEHPSGEDLNIRDIAIEKDEKRQELPFDPEKEISNSDWEGMKSTLEQYRREPNPPYFLFQAMAMKVLFPERISELNLDDEAWEIAKRILVNDDKGEWSNTVWPAMMKRAVFPEKKEEISQNDKITEENWKNMEEVLEGKVGRGAWGWLFMGYPLIQGTFFGPNVKELPEHIDEKIWQEMKQRLNNFRITAEKADNWFNFTRLALEMKILAAHKVEITDQGVECIMRPPETDFHGKKTKRPERRQF